VRDEYCTSRLTTRGGRRRCRKLETELENFPCVEFDLNSKKGKFVPLQF
jgi:hypothetical protein